ncbi:unnamed protein product [Lactuca saligna]|uniref:Uncharacterized protein n=1 Tax=Lactuca saligna TaxID=75948 RepID=A0AA35YVS3_LACSI|nr:unnamed protein product [Lactuca saligna]
MVMVTLIHDVLLDDGDVVTGEMVWSGGSDNTVVEASRILVAYELLVTKGILEEERTEHLSLFFPYSSRFLSFVLLSSKVLFLFSSMVDPSGTLPTEVKYKFLAETYGLSSADGVEFPSPGSSIMSPLPGKVGVYLKTLDAGLHLPLTDFQEEVLQKDG